MNHPLSLFHTFRISEGLLNMDGWQCFLHQWPMASMSGELVKSRVGSWTGYNSAERSVMDCDSKGERRDNSGTSDTGSQRYRVRWWPFSVGSKWPSSCAVLYLSLFITFCACLSLCFHCWGWLSGADQVTLLVWQVRWINTCWRNLPTQTLKVFGDKALGTWSYFLLWNINISLHKFHKESIYPSKFKAVYPTLYTGFQLLCVLLIFRDWFTFSGKTFQWTILIILP